MPTPVIEVDPLHPNPEAIRRAADVLCAGGLVAFPTETVYGLGANALDADAVARIFAAKGRPAINPVIVHVADNRSARELAADWPALADLFAERFWPGPLTLVVPRNARVPDIVTAGGPTVGLRLPRHPVALALLRACGVPLAAPSANRSSALSPTRAEHVASSLDGRIDLILDGGPTSGGLESTVLDLSVSPPRLLRPGLVSLAELEEMVGAVQHVAIDTVAGALPSPGLLPRHYAPHTPLEIVVDSGSERIAELCRRGFRIGWITCGHVETKHPGVVHRSLPPAPDGYASQLYAVLHELDAAGLDRIVLASPPRTDAWLAVHDRLRRASTP